MSNMKTRIQTLEAQLNAMAQAWMYLASHIEIECGLEMEPMENALRNKYWGDNPEIDCIARGTLNWLCSELADAREVRLIMQQKKAGLKHQNR